MARQTASSMTRQPQIAGSPGPAARCPTRDSKILSELKPPNRQHHRGCRAPHVWRRDSRHRTSRQVGTPQQGPVTLAGRTRTLRGVSVGNRLGRFRNIAIYVLARIHAGVRGPRVVVGSPKLVTQSGDPTCRAVAASFAGADGAAHALSRMVPRRWLQRLRSSPFRGVWRQLSHRTCPASGCSPLTFPGCPSR